MNPRPSCQFDSRSDTQAIVVLFQIRNYIFLFTRASSGPYPESLPFYPTSHLQFFRIHLYLNLPPMRPSQKWYLEIFVPKFCMQISYLSYSIHVTPVSSNLICVNYEAFHCMTFTHPPVLASLLRTHILLNTLPQTFSNFIPYFERWNFTPT
jgi:hypothetical protein